MSLTRGGHAGRDWQLRARNETDLQCTRVLKVNKPDLRQLPSQVSTVRLGFDTHVRDTQHECAHAFSLNSKARVKAMIRVLGIYRELAKGFAGARVRKTARRALHETTFAIRAQLERAPAGIIRADEACTAVGRGARHGVAQSEVWHQVVWTVPSDA